MFATLRPFLLKKETLEDVSQFMQHAGGTSRQMEDAVVYVVDDDYDASKALISLIESMRLKAVGCSSAEDFLEKYSHDLQLKQNFDCCLLTDLRMKGMSGVDLIKHLKARGITIPTIVISGYAEISASVEAMQEGAVTFLEKTSSNHKICEAITRAVELSASLRQAEVERRTIKEIWASLSKEEQETLSFVAQGMLNKEIAAKVNLSKRAIEDRRRRLMQKVGASNVVELIRFAVKIEAITTEEQARSHDNNS